MEDKTYSVSEAVRLVGVESHVLRYWEEELHISIQRNAQGHRLYSKGNITLFRKVKDWKEKGLQLKAIRILLAQTDAIRRSEATGRSEAVRGAETAGKSEAVRGAEATGRSDAVREMETATFAEQLEEVFDLRTDDQQESDSRTENLQGCDDSVCDIENDPCVCEVVPTVQAEAQDGLARIAAVFRQIVKEAAREQNEHLEKILAEQLREEAKDIYLQYFQMLQEAAAAKSEMQKESVRQGILRRIWDAIGGGRY